MQAWPAFGMANGQSPFARVPGNDVSYLHADHLQSTTNTTGDETSGSQYYYPYGGNRGTNEVATEYQYTGQRWQDELGLYYYRARWYDPRMRRFVQADTIVPEPGNPQSLNRYSYGLNNPVKYNDPSGHYVFEQGPSDPWIFGNGQVRSHDYWTHPEGGGFEPVSDEEIWLALTSPAWGAAAALGVGAAGEMALAGGASAVVAAKAAAEAAFAAIMADGDPLNEAQAIYDTLAADGDATNEVNSLLKVSDQVASRGSTGRLWPNSLEEQLAMGEVMADPLAPELGARVLDVRMTDPLWHQAEGWVKMACNNHGIEIHFVFNEALGLFDDFKFK